jgi:hypothetical protein
MTPIRISYEVCSVESKSISPFPYCVNEQLYVYNDMCSFYSKVQTIIQFNFVSKSDSAFCYTYPFVLPPRVPTCTYDI